MPRLLLLLLAFPLAGCADEADQLVLYAARPPAHVEPVVQRFQAATGLSVEVRYGTDAELLAALQAEGPSGPADLFWADAAGTMGRAINADLLTMLPDSLLAPVAAFVPRDRFWTPVSFRFRVLAYVSDRVDTAALPDSVLDLPGATALRGRLGWVPASASFYTFIAAMEHEKGERALLRWVEGVKALEPTAYASDAAMLDALAAGEIDAALTDDVAVFRRRYGGVDETGEVRQDARPDAPVALHPMAEGDLGNLVLATGVGVLQSSRKPAVARRFVAHLLQPEAQAAGVEVLHEYPAVRGLALPDGFVPFERALLLTPDLELERFNNPRRIAELLREHGVE